MTVLTDSSTNPPALGHDAYLLRRADREITDRATLDALLARGDIGHLGLVDAGRPYVVPLNYAYAEGRIYFHSAPEGRKIAAMRANPQVCFQVEEHYGTVHSNRARPHSSHYASVMAFGSARIVGADDVDGQMYAMQLLLDKYAPGRHYHPLHARELAGMVTVVVTVEALTGKARAPFYPRDRVRLARHVLAADPAAVPADCPLGPYTSARVDHVDGAGWVHLVDHAQPVRWELLESVKGPM